MIEPKLEHPSPEHAKAPAETWRILFLDCDANIERLKGACRDAGYVVVGATSIAEAWSFLQGHDHADVIVCAAHLEDESMLEFLQAIRRDAHHRDTMFLILSLEASAAGVRLERSTRTSGLVLGADAYLTMPRFDSDALIAEIGRLRPDVPTLQAAPDASAERQIAEEARRIDSDNR